MPSDQQFPLTSATTSLPEARQSSSSSSSSSQESVTPVLPPATEGIFPL